MYLMHIGCQIKQNTIQYAINCLLNQFLQRETEAKRSELCEHVKFCLISHQKTFLSITFAKGQFKFISISVLEIF